MKELKLLRRIHYLLESVHLSLMVCCLSLPLLFFFPSGSWLSMTLWGIGAIIPVLLIRELSMRISRPWLRFLAGMLVTLSAILIPRGMIGFTYGICCGIITLIGAFFPRPDGKLVLTVPKFYHILIVLLAFGLGKISGVDLLVNLITVLALLFCGNYLLYLHSARLEKTLCEDLDATVSSSSILALNRRLIVGFLLVAALLIVGIPWLVSRVPASEGVAESPVETQLLENTAPPVETFPVENPVYVSPGTPLDYRALETGTLLFTPLLVITALFFVGLAIILLIRMLRNDKDRHSEPDSNSFVVERLAEQPRSAAVQDFSFGNSWQKKIRRQYHRLLGRNIEKNPEHTAMTPAELEAAANLPRGGSLETLHTIYEKARYSDLPCTQEDYKRVHAAAKELSGS